MSDPKRRRQHGFHSGIGGLVFSPRPSRSSNRATETLRRWPWFHPSRSRSGRGAEGIRPHWSDECGTGKSRDGSRAGPPWGSPPEDLGLLRAKQPERTRPASSGRSVRSAPDPRPPLLGGTRQDSTANPLGDPTLCPAKSRSSSLAPQAAPPCPALPIQRGTVTRPRTRLRALGIPPRWTRAKQLDSARVGRSLSEQFYGPMAFFYLRVRANEA